MTSKYSKDEEFNMMSSMLPGLPKTLPHHKTRNWDIRDHVCLSLYQ